MTTTKKISPTRALAAKVIYAGLSILRDNGKELPVRDLMEKIEKAISLDAWAKERYEKTGYVRWESIFHFYSIDCVKAGWVIKKKGIWYLTPEGEDSLKLGADKLLDTASQLYRKWRADNPVTPKEEDEEEGGETGVEEQSAKLPSYDDIEQRAIEGLQQYINAKNPYEFQDLVAALLRGMGYYTPFVAPKGKDGGVRRDRVPRSIGDPVAENSSTDKEQRSNGKCPGSKAVDGTPSEGRGRGNVRVHLWLQSRCTRRCARFTRPCGTGGFESVHHALAGVL